MGEDKDILIETLRLRSQQKLAHLAGEFARAASEDREAILAAMEFERWLAECCVDVTDRMPEPPGGRL